MALDNLRRRDGSGGVRLPPTVSSEGVLLSGLDVSPQVQGLGVVLLIAERVTSTEIQWPEKWSGDASGFGLRRKSGFPEPDSFPGRGNGSRSLEEGIKV